MSAFNQRPVGQASHHNSQLGGRPRIRLTAYPRSIPLHRLMASLYSVDGAIHSHRMGEQLRRSSEKQLLTLELYVAARPPCCHGLERTDRTVASIFVGAFDPVHTLPFFLTDRRAETTGTFCSPNEQFLYPSLKSKGLQDLHLH